jgi:non-lysosomal glucosylceramidase
MQSAAYVWLLPTASAAAASLYEELSGVAFLNEGVTTAADRYHWENIVAVGAGQKLIYLEAENVSCAPCSMAGWSDQQKYYAPHPYKFTDGAAATGAATGGAKPGDPGVYGGGTPASGMRSAVPLGGVGAGSFELRGDGTLHEWTIHNANPAGAAKVQEYPFAHFGLAVNGAARVLQTDPSQASLGNAVLGAAGVKALRYGGAHPVSRLDVLDDLGGSKVNASLFAYSVFKHNDMDATARPAAAFTLSVKNDGAEAANVSFLFQVRFSQHPQSHTHANSKRASRAPRSVHAVIRR